MEVIFFKKFSPTVIEYLRMCSSCFQQRFEPSSTRPITLKCGFWCRVNYLAILTNAETSERKDYVKTVSTPGEEFRNCSVPNWRHRPIDEHDHMISNLMSVLSERECIEQALPFGYSRIWIRDSHVGEDVPDLIALQAIRGVRQDFACRFKM
jgi:hypothetical protein